MSFSIGNVSLKLAKRVLSVGGASNVSQQQSFNSVAHFSNIAIEQPHSSIQSLVTDSHLNLPPLLSEQGKTFIDKKKKYDLASEEISVKIQQSFPNAHKSEYNQCFSVTCDQNASLFIHALSGYTFCPKCRLVKLQNIFSTKCFPDINTQNNAQKDEQDKTYYSEHFAGQNVRKFLKADLESSKIKKTLQMHKASKLFLDTLEDFDCFVNYDTFSIYFTYRDANGVISGHEEVKCGNSSNIKSELIDTLKKSNESSSQTSTPAEIEVGKETPKSSLSGIMLKEMLGVEEDKYLIVTSGALNACAIYQCSSVTTLCIESCVKFEFPDEFVPLLASYDRIVFFLPDMSANYHIVHHISRILGQDRCYYISYQLGCKFKSPLDALKGLTSAQDFTDLLNEFSVPVNSLSSKFNDLINEARNFLADPSSSLGYPFHRFDPLNTLLGGLRLGEITVISGDTGMGKTTFATEMALDVCLHNNLPTAFVSLEMQPKITLLKMGRQLILQEVSLKNFQYFEDAITNVPMFISNCSGFVILKDVLLEFEKMCMQYGVRHIVIDHLHYLQGIELLDNKIVSSAEELVSVNRVLKKLKQFVSSYNIHMTLLAQPRKQYSNSPQSANSAAGSRILTNHDIAGTVALTQIPDNILILQSKNINYNKGSNGGAVLHGKTNNTSKYIEVTKNRFKGSLGTMPLMFCEKSGTFSLAAATHVSDT